MPSTQQLGAGWYEVLKPVFDTSWWKELHKKVWAAYPDAQPAAKDIFRAFRETPFVDVKVILVGQDCYPSSNYADGLAFSSGNGHCPSSLEYIYKELIAEYDAKPSGYSLESWAHQGVFLINTALTVTKGMPNSHSEFGWHKFTEEAIYQVLRKDPNTPIVSWGRPACQMVSRVAERLGIPPKGAIPGPHPIAESYSQGRIKFVGGNYFKRINDLLKEQGKEPIEWIF